MSTPTDTPDRQRTNPYDTPWPRNHWRRRILRFVGRAIFLALVQARVFGRHHFPRRGPAILVGNHNAFIETLMIVLYAPYPVEVLASGDLPLEPRYSRWADAYQYIPINRGSADRKALSIALSVLDKGGVVAIFPEGGISHSGVAEARTGVVWLSSKGKAPIVPIGFGGTRGAMANMMRLGRPRVTMRVGRPLPALPEKLPGKTRKETLEIGARRVMDAIRAQLPQEEIDAQRPLAEEQFEVVLDFGGPPLGNGAAPTIARSEALGRFLHRPVVLDALRRNLELPVDALQNLPTERNPARIADAVDVILGYLKVNPHYLTYRFGQDEGHEVEAALIELRDAARWAQAHNYSLSLKPIHRYRYVGDADLTVDEYPRPVAEI